MKCKVTNGKNNALYPIVKLKDISKYADTKVLTSELNSTNYVSTENLLPNKSGKMIASSIPTQKYVCSYKKGATLVSNIRPYFKKIWLANQNGGCSNDVLVFNVNSGINTKWFYYLLSQDSFFDFIMSGAKGTKMPRGDKTQIMNFEFQLPPLEEQKRIAGILGCLDDKIELNNKINQNLEAQAQAIFKSWFVDFEPFRDQPFIDSPLGKIPQGWKVGKLGDIAKISSGKRPLSKSELQTDLFSIPIVGASSVMGYTKNYLFNESILITGRVGTHGIIQRFTIPCWASDNTLVIKSNCHEYVYQLLKQVDFKSMNRGSTQPLITQNDLKNIEILISKQESLERFEKLIGKFFINIQDNQLQTQALTQLRDTLLPRLMNGEIGISKINVKSSLL